MADSKITGFTPLTNAQADDITKLQALGDPVTGILSSITTAQAKLIYSTQRVKYVATGSEGTALVIAALAARAILLITREGSVLSDIVSAPDTSEYTFNGTTITFGLALGAGERLIILYKNV